jgi:hypothetical protein
MRERAQILGVGWELARPNGERKECCHDGIGPRTRHPLWTIQHLLKVLHEQLRGPCPFRVNHSCLNIMCVKDGTVEMTISAPANASSAIVRVNSGNAVILRCLERL